jgi:hypothetical protein
LPLYTEATTVARTIGNAKSQARALRAIAIALAQAGEFTEATTVARTILTTRLTAKVPVLALAL